MGENGRDYVQEAYEHFVKGAEGTDPTDPVKAVEAYFAKNASDELKARCSAEGKDAQGCWKFIVAVARKVGGDCHIEPGTVYAMAMHWFEEVPADWGKGRRDGASPRTPKGAETAKADAAKDAEKPAETPAKATPAKSAKAKAKKPKSRQGSFLDMLEDETRQDGEVAE